MLKTLLRYGHWVNLYSLRIVTTFKFVLGKRHSLNYIPNKNIITIFIVDNQMRNVKRTYCLIVEMQENKFLPKYRI